MKNQIASKPHSIRRMRLLRSNSLRPMCTQLKYNKMTLLQVEKSIIYRKIKKEANNLAQGEKPKNNSPPTIKRIRHKPTHQKNKESYITRKIRDKQRQILEQQIRQQLLQRIEFHQEKMIKLTEIGVPTINFNESKVHQYIRNHCGEILKHDENSVMKIIGIVGESYVEELDDVSSVDNLTLQKSKLKNPTSIQSLEQKQFIIQRKVIQMLIKNDIFLNWDQEKWNDLIKKSFIKLPFPQVSEVVYVRNLTSLQRYSQIFQALSVITHFKEKQLCHQFLPSDPLQTVNEIILDDITNQMELANVRAIRCYLCNVMNALNSICLLKQTIDNQTLNQLYSTSTKLQNEIENYFQIKQNLFSLKKSNNQQTISQQLLQIFDKQHEQDLVKQCSNQKPETKARTIPCHDGKVKQSLPTKVSNQDRGTILQFFKVIKKGTDGKQVEKNNQNIEQSNNEMHENQKSSVNYFNLLENYITNGFEWIPNSDSTKNKVGQ